MFLVSFETSDALVRYCRLCIPFGCLVRTNRYISRCTASCRAYRGRVQQEVFNPEWFNSCFWWDEGQLLENTITGSTSKGFRQFQLLFYFIELLHACWKLNIASECFSKQTSVVRTRGDKLRRGERRFRYWIYRKDRKQLGTFDSQNFVCSSVVKWFTWSFFERRRELVVLHEISEHIGNAN